MAARKRKCPVSDLYCCANDCGRNPAFLRAGFAPAACRANRFRPLRSGNPASRKIHLFQLRFRNTSTPAVDLPADLLRRKIMRRRTVTRLRHGPLQIPIPSPTPLPARPADRRRAVRRAARQKAQQRGHTHTTRFIQTLPP